MAADSPHQRDNELGDKERHQLNFRSHYHPVTCLTYMFSIHILMTALRNRILVSLIALVLVFYATCH